MCFDTGAESRSEPEAPEHGVTKYTRTSTLWTAALALTSLALPLAGQAQSQQMDPATMIANAQRAMVSRAELQTALDQLDQQLGSTAYSAALREAKQNEADAIRSRLADGDLHTGDVVAISVVGDATFTSQFPVTANRTLLLPGGIEISVAGVLRSELQDYITNQLKKYLKDPVVRTLSSIRISMFGGIGKPGFYSVPANLLLSDVIQSVAGGPANNAQFNKSQITRQGKVVVDGPEFALAVYQGKTLDQLNLQAGDQITVAQKGPGGKFFRIIGGVTAIASLAWLGLQLHIF